MKGYRIKTVASATGVRPELLRAWERRYKVVSPTRSAGGYREYSEHDVVKLRLLRDLTGRGFAIGEVANLPVEELQRLAGEGEAEAGVSAVLPAAEPSPSDALVRFAVDDDAGGLRDGLRRVLTMLPTAEAIDGVLLPLLRELAWRQQRDGQTRPRRLAAAAIRGFVGPLGPLGPSTTAPLVLVATPADHPAEVELVEALLHCLAAGTATVCLAVEDDELASAARALNVDLVVLCAADGVAPPDLLRWPSSPPLIAVGTSGPFPTTVRTARTSFDLPNALASVLDPEE
jgi:MerR family transcriptional regulator, light-induced transcriptional regulator